MRESIVVFFKEEFLLFLYNQPSAKILLLKSERKFVIVPTKTELFTFFKVSRECPFDPTQWSSRNFTENQIPLRILFS